ncbi:hypothetical protein SLEP1_g15673 [Rubroshorea leprosula]|uniref:P-type H(+)-exporting transporter n=1 Tax=Rubroshorea leprosula TaxID=152421 RepID=A0AAV5IYM7_9ROSI|nr:hypothetical protein SLEP1_g15673 [Rubroshorea leprosula]
MHEGWVDKYRRREQASYLWPQQARREKGEQILKFLGFMWDALSWVMESAAIMAIALANGEEKPPVVLLVINSTISFIEENNAGNAAAALMAGLAPKTKVLRDGKWSDQDAAIFGSRRCDYTPSHQEPRDEIFSGSTCKQGEIEAVVITTGVHTFFGKAAHLVDSTNNIYVGHFQKVLTAIGNFCIFLIRLGMGIEIIVMYPIQHMKYRDGAITKRVTAIEEMAGMDVVCSDKTGTLTLNKLTVDKNLIEGVDKDTVVLLAARASRVENQDAIDASIVGMLGDPKESRAGITEKHFLPFNPVDKRTAITYIDSNGEWHRVSKGAPDQIIELCGLKGEIEKKAHQVIDTFAERGLRFLAVSQQRIPEKTQESAREPWEFVGLLPLFDPPRHDSAETIRQALELGVNVKMITGDQLANIGKETGRRLGMGTNMYPSSSLLGESKDEALAAIPFDELIKKADGFAGVFPDIGIAVADATDAARSASDIVLTEPGLSVIISAVLTSRAIFQRMKNYTIYAVSITIRIVLGFMLVALIWKFDFSPFMGQAISVPDSWKLREIFATGVVLGAYMAVMTVVFFWLANDTDFFTEKFGLKPIHDNNNKLTSALYLQVATVIAVYANWGLSRIEGIGWGWAAVIWIYSVITYVPLDVIKFVIRYTLSGDKLLQNKGKEEREAQWALAQRTLHGLQTPQTIFNNNNIYLELSEIAEQAKRRAEVARLRELHTLKGHVESVVKLKGLDIYNIRQHYTV